MRHLGGVYASPGWRVCVTWVAQDLSRAKKEYSLLSQHIFPMKKTIIALCLFFCCVIAQAGGQAKYVFYFIGDGMGTTHVNGTETYLAATEGRIGTTPLCFASFPYSAFITTHSAKNGVTDSAAAGTALATGQKTFNGALGVDVDTTSINSLATWAYRSGAAVGVGTTVTIDHATPGAFYAHVPYRKMDKEIDEQLRESCLDFIAGADIQNPSSSAYQQMEGADFTIIRGVKDYNNVRKQAKRLMLLQTEDGARRSPGSLPYAIDRKPGDLTLANICRAGIDFLSSFERKSKGERRKGFFLMLEGGKIDYAGHANDAATCFHEVVDMDEAIKVALEFYEKHPKETLIVVTADHETGGLVLGRGHYSQHSQYLQYQKMSAEVYSKHISELRQSLGDNFTWERVKADLQENWGFGREVPITEKQEQRLRKAFDDILAGIAKESRNLYAVEGALASTAKWVMAEQAEISWASGSHSNSYVPCFAIGAGAELFHGRMDNTDIPKAIAKAAGWEGL